MLSEKVEAEADKEERENAPPGDGNILHMCSFWLSLNISWEM